MNCHDKFQITCQGNAKSHGNPRKLAAPRRFGSDQPITNGFFFLTLQHFFVSAVWSRRLAWPLSLSWFLLVRLKINDHVLYSRHVPDSGQRLPGKGVKRAFPSTIVFLTLSSLPSPPLWCLWWRGNRFPFTFVVSLQALMEKFVKRWDLNKSWPKNRHAFTFEGNTLSAVSLLNCASPPPPPSFQQWFHSLQHLRRASGMHTIT